nr:hypothetical protein [uncultured Terrisporobacter sp.]
MENIVSSLNSIVWSYALVWTCLGVGIYFSLRTRFSQLRNIKEMVDRRSCHCNSFGCKT